MIEVESNDGTRFNPSIGGMTGLAPVLMKIFSA
jgi:hypothetical protein